MNQKLFFGFTIAFLNVLHWVTFLQADSYFSEIKDPDGSYQFFENQYYKFTTTNRNLFISDEVNSDANLSEVFPSKHISSDEYILFNATHSSPRLNYYFDPDNLDFNGSIEVIPYLEEGPIVSDDLSMDDYFGYEITFNDWNETIVSAPFDSDGNGSIYIFELNSSNQLSLKGKLHPEEGDEGWWGESILALGDLLFVGAPNSNAWSGEVIVYQRSFDGGTYEKEYKISDPSTGLMHSFGNAISGSLHHGQIAISPNVEGDRFGRVEIFQLDAFEDWNHSQTLWSENNTSGNRFGIAHAQSDEFLIIGAPGESEGQGGRAYIYSRDEDDFWRWDDKNPFLF